MSKEYGFKARQTIRIEQVANSLDSKAKSLIHDLEVIREKIAHKKFDRLNSLGEVQGRGQDIDMMCCQIHTLLESIEMYEVWTDHYKEGE